MNELNYLFCLASSMMRQYIVDTHQEVISDYIDMCGSFQESLGFVADMCVLDTFRLLDSINYF